MAQKFRLQAAVQFESDPAVICEQNHFGTLCFRFDPQLYCERTGGHCAVCDRDRILFAVECQNGPFSAVHFLHKRKPVWEYSAVLPALRTSPGDVYIVRFTDVAGRQFSASSVHFLSAVRSRNLCRIPFVQEMSSRKWRTGDRSRAGQNCSVSRKHRIPGLAWRSTVDGPDGRCVFSREASFHRSPIR